MSISDSVNRSNFFERIHQQFLALKGYGTYAYLTPLDVERLYQDYTEQLARQSQLTATEASQLQFIRAYIKSL